MITIRIPLPRIDSGAVTNLIGVAGLLAIAFAVGALADNFWWAVLLGGVFAFAVSALNQAMAQQTPPKTRPLSTVGRTG